MSSIPARSFRPRPSRLMGLGITATVLAMLLSPVPTAADTSAAPATHTDAPRTAYPGGTWEPGPAEYGVSEPAPETVTMPDGAVLDAQFTAPTDRATGRPAAGPFPVILTIDPYRLAKVDLFVEHGYIVASARPRGTGKSTGTIDAGGRRDQADAGRLVDWAAGLPGSTGDVALYGCSYPGYYALLAAGSVPKGSPVKAAFAACAGGNPGYFSHETAMKGGILTDWMYNAGDFGPSVVCDPAEAGCNPEVVSATLKWWQDLEDEQRAGGARSYDGTFWKTREKYFGAQAARNGIPTLLWSSFQDEAESSVIQTWVQQQNVVAGRDLDNPMHEGQKTSAKYQVLVGEGPHGAYMDDGIALEWFDTWVKGLDTGLQRTSNSFHVMDQANKDWVNVPRFPLTSSYTTLQLGGHGRLGTGASSSGSDTLPWVEPSEKSPDTSYTTRPLKRAATIGGHMNAVVYARSSNRNLQLVATLSDVAPDGTVVPISADNAVLGSQRTLDDAKTWHDKQGRVIRPWYKQDRDRYLRPGKAYRFDIAMEPRLYTMKKGHRIRLTLSTHVDQSTCQSVTTWEALPCYHTDKHMKSLRGGVYEIVYRPGERSRLNLPLVSGSCLRTAGKSVTPTSDSGFSVPSNWSRGSKC